jgi:hypothetical protein
LPAAREDSPLNTARLIVVLAAACALAAARPARAQRMQFGAAQPEGSFVDPAPPATLEGTIQPLDPNWDPYAQPGYQAPALLPQEGGVYGQPGAVYGQPQGAGPGVAPGERLLQQITGEWTWIDGGGEEFDLNTVEISGTLSVPFYYGVAPLLLTPGAAVHFLDGPKPPLGPDLPPRVYDAYVDVGWRPQITQWLAVDVGVRPGVFSDFEDFESESFRIKGRGLAIFTVSPRAQIVAGVIYLDRIKVKLLPAGGLIWMPDEDSRYEILFPRPKLAQRITTYQNIDVWAYLAGEYGGGSWSVEDVPGSDAFDYNDLRVAVGLELISFTGMRGHFEFGYVFDREIVFDGPTADFKPDDALMLRAGIIY